MYKILCSGIGLDREPAGMIEYVRETVMALCREHRVDLLLPEKEAAAWKEHRDELKIVPVPERYSMRRGGWWGRLGTPMPLPSEDYDFVFLPFGGWQPFRTSALPTVVTVHDLLSFQRCHEGGRWQRFRRRCAMLSWLRRAQVVMALSESIRNDLVTDCHLDPNKVVVNYNGFDSTRYYPDSRHDEPEILRKLHLDPGYILYLSRVEHPVKNHLNLLKAYEMLPEWQKKSHPLVCAGNLWRNWEVPIKYAESSLDRHRMLFPGFVPDDWLPCLYRNAALYVYPSLYEGFAFSLLEAMSCGIPIACSDCSSLPEIGGDAVITFNPESPESIRDAMRSILTDPVLRNELVRKGYNRKENFSRRRHADNIIAAYERYRDGRKAS
ncbi:MAG: glycosyltransferase family 1 protein [Victivallales bacterium]|nr:glycosyltransferase family 1 protein [Victivallales bacterium]